MIQSKTQLKPRTVLAIESLNKRSFSRMFGCAELEKVACQVVNWLADNGNDWTVPLPDISQFGSAWDRSHGHGDGAVCRFSDFIENGVVSNRFIQWVTRDDDDNSLSLDSIRRLFPLEEDRETP